MKRFFLVAMTGLVAVSLATFTGCGSKKPSANPPAKTAGEHSEGDGHDHSKESGK
ncbi:MAG: hypothetical protein ACYC3X_20210 [Pirellulaceae bacterium]